jgi:hypothetical protein
MNDSDLPNFAAWQTDTLAKYALEQYLQNIEMRRELEQLRLKLLDAQETIRRTADDWK